jgi:hypothetical protein
MKVTTVTLRRWAIMKDEKIIETFEGRENAVEVFCREYSLPWYSLRYVEISWLEEIKEEE